MPPFPSLYHHIPCVQNLGRGRVQQLRFLPASVGPPAKYLLDGVSLSLPKLKLKLVSHSKTPPHSPHPSPFHPFPSPQRGRPFCTVSRAGARSYSTLVIKKRGGWNEPIWPCLHHNPPHSADVMLMNTVEKAQLQNCPLSFTLQGAGKEE